MCWYTIEGGWFGEPALAITQNKKADADGSAWEYDVQLARQVSRSLSLALSWSLMPFGIEQRYYGYYDL